MKMLRSNRHDEGPTSKIDLEKLIINENGLENAFPLKQYRVCYRFFISLCMIARSLASNLRHRFSAMFGFSMYVQSVGTL